MMHACAYETWLLYSLPRGRQAIHPRARAWKGILPCGTLPLQTSHQFGSLTPLEMFPVMPREPVLGAQTPGLWTLS